MAGKAWGVGVRTYLKVPAGRHRQYLSFFLGSIRSPWTTNDSDAVCFVHHPMNASILWRWIAFQPRVRLRTRTYIYDEYVLVSIALPLPVGSSPPTRMRPAGHVGDAVTPSFPADAPAEGQRGRATHRQGVVLLKKRPRRFISLHQGYDGCLNMHLASQIWAVTHFSASIHRRRMVVAMRLDPPAATSSHWLRRACFCGKYWSVCLFPNVEDKL